MAYLFGHFPTISTELSTSGIWEHQTASMRSAEFLLLARYIIVMGFLNYQLQNQETPKGQRCAKLTMWSILHFWILWWKVDAGIPMPSNSTMTPSSPSAYEIHHGRTVAARCSQAHDFTRPDRIFWWQIPCWAARRWSPCWLPWRKALQRQLVSEKPSQNEWSNL